MKRIAMVLALLLALAGALPALAEDIGEAVAVEAAQDAASFESLPSDGAEIAGAGSAAEAVPETQALPGFGVLSEPEAVAVTSNDGAAHGSGVMLAGKTAKATLKLGSKAAVDLDGATGAKWKSSDKKVATVSSKGVVTGKKRGTAKITVKATAGGKTATRTLTVKVVDPKDPKSVKILWSDEDSVGVASDGTWDTIPGATIALRAEVSPAGANKQLSWKSSDKKVVAVSKKGRLKCLKPGKATISVTTVNGKRASFRVKVHSNRVKLPAPGKAEVKRCIAGGKVMLALRSVEVVSSDKVVAKFTLVNGSDRKISSLRNLKAGIGLEWYSGGKSSKPFYREALAYKKFSSVKVRCKRHGTATVKLTFTGKSVKNVANWLGEDSLSVRGVTSFKY